MLAFVVTWPVVALAQQRVPVPVEAMAREPFLSQVQLSPDGEHMVALSSLDGENTQVAIWRTGALDQAPVRFGVGGASARSNVRFAGVTWVSNDRLLVLMQQPVVLGAGADGRFYTAMARIVSLDGRRWVEPMEQGGRRSDLEQFADKFLNIGLLDQLPNDPDHVLMVRSTLDETAIYRVNVNTGRGEPVTRLSERENIAAIVDSRGNPRVKATVDFRDGDWMIGYEVFNPEARRWEAHSALSSGASQRRGLSVLALDPANEDILIVLDDEGRNFAHVRGYSISRRVFVETLFEHAEHDASGVIMDTNAMAPMRVVGFRYLADTERSFYSDPTYRALYEGLQTRLPGLNLELGPKNGRYRIVAAESSIQPRAYFLLTDDTQLAPLGESRPGIPTRQLAVTELIYYTARDGMRIPAFLTLPFGYRRGIDAPLPTMIQPHGGPWGRNDTSWGGGDVPVTQYFASRGFAVLQPQFRGSTGWGNQLWRAGDAQWGLSMQDDKDDGLAWLVTQGIADPDRAMIYGFSYGGFAAMAAAVRPDSPYRCAISGAGVASLERLGTLWRQNFIQRRTQGVTVRGMDPLEHASEANIPILLYHGDYDQTAEMWHSEHFASALRAAGKDVQFVTIPEMPHGALTPAMRRREFELIEGYIRGTCGILY
ncbi:MAG: prolyl oligopeptidase family serine peptidase [Terricaulis sp.]